MKPAVRVLTLLTAVLCTPVSLFAQTGESDTRGRGYWVDPSTGLMWAGKDNGRELNWRQATRYCLDLELRGYADWRVPTIDELKAIFEPSIRPGWERHEKYPTFRVKGNPILTGDSWSASNLVDAAGRPTPWVLFFDFTNGQSFQHDQDFRIGKRALCVRGGDRTELSAEDHAMAADALVRGYWVDPSTELMWAGKDNFGRDLNWRQAAKYCGDFQLAGYTDWRLPTIAELEGIYDPGARASGLRGQRNEKGTDWHVKGNLFLTGWAWSASHRVDDRGRPVAWAFFFDFGSRGRRDEQLGFRTFKRALCVREDPPALGIRPR